MCTIRPNGEGARSDTGWTDAARPTGAGSLEACSCAGRVATRQFVSSNQTVYESGADTWRKGLGGINGALGRAEHRPPAGRIGGRVLEA